MSDRSRISLKLLTALEGEITDLPIEKQKILIDDLTTAFLNRIKVLRKNK